MESRQPVTAPSFRVLATPRSPARSLLTAQTRPGLGLPPAFPRPRRHESGAPVPPGRPPRKFGATVGQVGPCARVETSEEAAESESMASPFYARRDRGPQTKKARKRSLSTTRPVPSLRTALEDPSPERPRRPPEPLVGSSRGRSGAPVPTTPLNQGSRRSPRAEPPTIGRDGLRRARGGLGRCDRATVTPSCPTVPPRGSKGQR